MSVGIWRHKIIWPCHWCDSSFSKRIKLRDHVVSYHHWPIDKADVWVSIVKPKKVMKTSWLR